MPAFYVPAASGRSIVPFGDFWDAEGCETRCRNALGLRRLMLSRFPGRNGRLTKVNSGAGHRANFFFHAQNGQGRASTWREARSHFGLRRQTPAADGVRVMSMFGASCRRRFASKLLKNLSDFRVGAKQKVLYVSKNPSYAFSLLSQCLAGTGRPGSNSA
jgi:hypothetical protein